MLQGRGFKDQLRPSYKLALVKLVGYMIHDPLLFLVFLFLCETKICNSEDRRETQMILKIAKMLMIQISV